MLLIHTLAIVLTQQSMALDGTVLQYTGGESSDIQAVSLRQSLVKPLRTYRLNPNVFSSGLSVCPGNAWVAMPSIADTVKGRLLLLNLATAKQMVIGPEGLYRCGTVPDSGYVFGLYVSPERGIPTLRVYNARSQRIALAVSGIHVCLWLPRLRRLFAIRFKTESGVAVPWTSQEPAHTADFFLLNLQSHRTHRIPLTRLPAEAAFAWQVTMARKEIGADAGQLANGGVWLSPDGRSALIGRSKKITREGEGDPPRNLVNVVDSDLRIYHLNKAGYVRVSGYREGLQCLGWLTNTKAVCLDDQTLGILEVTSGRFVHLPVHGADRWLAFFRG